MVIKMNGTYYQNPTFPGAQSPNNYTDNIETVGVPLTMEQSYIENILRLNKGKEVKVYVSYPDSVTWKDSIYEGIIQEAGRDHLIISDPNTGKWFMILMIYLNYVEFNERINYSHSYSDKTF